MPISKEDDKSSREQYHIILLSHIVRYWIWSLLDSDESLVVTRVSPPIFGLQHCCRFSKRMQLKNGGLKLNTLFLDFFLHHLYLFFLFSFFLFHSFYSLYFFLFYFPRQPMLILTCLSWCHKFELHFMSLMPQRECSPRLSVLKLSHAHRKRRWQEFVGAISHNTSFTHCAILNLILAWFGRKFGGN